MKPQKVNQLRQSRTHSVLLTSSLFSTREKRLPIIKIKHIYHLQYNEIHKFIKLVLTFS